MRRRCRLLQVYRNPQELRTLLSPAGATRSMTLDLKRSVSSSLALLRCDTSSSDTSSSFSFRTIHCSQRSIAFRFLSSRMGKTFSIRYIRCLSSRMEKTFRIRGTMLRRCRPLPVSMHSSQEVRNQSLLPAAGVTGRRKFQRIPKKFQCIPKKVPARRLDLKWCVALPVPLPSLARDSLCRRVIASQG